MLVPLSVLSERFPAARSLIGRTFSRTTNTFLMLDFVRSILEVPAGEECSTGAQAALDRLFQSILDEEFEAFCRTHSLKVGADVRKNALSLRIRNYIQMRLGDAELNAAEIAAAHNISERTLFELFSEEDSSVMAFLWKALVNFAKKLLADPRLRHISIGEVAYRSGFKNVSHFSKRFRAATGTTPKAWREAAFEEMEVREAQKAREAQEAREAGKAAGGLPKVLGVTAPASAARPSAAPMLSVFNPDFGLGSASGKSALTYRRAYPRRRNNSADPNRMKSKLGSADPGASPFGSGTRARKLKASSSLACRSRRSKQSNCRPSAGGRGRFELSAICRRYLKFVHSTTWQSLQSAFEALCSAWQVVHSSVLP